MELKFSLGQKVMYKGEKSKIVGIDERHISSPDYCYLITTNMDNSVAEFYSHKLAFKNYNRVTFLSDGVSDNTRCRWVMEGDLEGIEPKSVGCDLSEEYLEVCEKVLELTLEVKEIEAEIEKIKKEWGID